MGKGDYQVKNFFIKTIQKDWVILIIQLFLGYEGWNITSQTIINSSVNTIGLWLIIIGILIRPIIKLVFKTLKFFNKERNLEKI